MSKYIVTRQSYWHEAGALGVEIALDDQETWNPGALSERYEEDFFTSDDPREIAKAAIRLRTRWRQDVDRDTPIAFTFSFNDLCYPGLYEEDTIYDLTRWGEKTWEEMPKCAFCGGVIANEKEAWVNFDLGDEWKFCSERCAEKEWIRQHKELAADECPNRDDCAFHDPPDIATCGNCGLSWDDAIVTSWTPAPSGRCPFEHFHKYIEDTDIVIPMNSSAIPDDFPVRPIDTEEND